MSLRSDFGFISIHGFLRDSKKFAYNVNHYFWCVNGNKQ